MYFLESPVLVRRLIPSAIWQIKTRKRKIFLTFDDGPNPQSTPQILSILRAYQIQATFFCTGKNVLNNKDLYADIINSGHTTGNHSFDHLDSWKTSQRSYLENVEKASKVIHSELFRPPYGRLKPGSWFYLKRKYSIIMWSLMSYDFDPSVNPSKIIETFIGKTMPGSIWLFHDSSKAITTLHKTLPVLIEYFLQKGFDFDVIDENKLKG
jgi:peptidoglycan/xylan/chitin deacetylase (PgdA/CDA1 family)